MFRRMAIRRAVSVAGIFFGLCTFSFTAERLALGKEQHGAHEHGVAELNIALNGKTAEIDFASPSISIYGFEHEAKAKNDVAKRDKAVETFKADIGSMIIFDASLGCKITVKSVEPFVPEGKKPDHGKHAEHGEMHAALTAACEKDPSGSKLRLAFWSKFSGMRAVKVQVVGDKVQTGGTLSANRDSIDLK